MTLSPGRNSSTPAPTSFTTPASSLPGENGSGGLNWYLFWMMSTSGKLTLAAFIVMTTSPSPGRGEGRFSKTKASGGPYCLQSTAFIVGLHYANPRYRRRRQALLRGSGQRDADRVRARVRRRLPQLGAPGTPLLAPLPLHRLQRARLSAVRRTGGFRALFAGARARRHPLRARRARHPARARRGLVDGRVRHAALRHDLRLPRELDHRRGRRLRLASGAIPPLPGGVEKERRDPQAPGDGAFRRHVRAWPATRAARGEGSARLCRVPAPVQGALRARRREHAARRAMPPAVVLRPHGGDGARGRAHPHHVGRRRGAVPGSEPPHEARDPLSGARGPAAQRPRHQPRRARTFQPPARGFLPPGRERALDAARPALDHSFDLRPLRKAMSLRTEKRAAVGWLVLDRPERRNAINGEMWRGIASAIAQFDADPEIRCIAFRGAGIEAFSAGADISEFE